MQEYKTYVSHKLRIRVCTSPKRCMIHHLKQQIFIGLGGGHLFSVRVRVRVWVRFRFRVGVRIRVRVRGT